MKRCIAWMLALVMLLSMSALGEMDGFELTATVSDPIITMFGEPLYDLTGANLWVGSTGTLDGLLQAKLGVGANGLATNFVGQLGLDGRISFTIDGMEHVYYVDLLELMEELMANYSELIEEAIADLPFDLDSLLDFALTSSTDEAYLLEDLSLKSIIDECRVQIVADAGTPEGTMDYVATNGETVAAQYATIPFTTEQLVASLRGMMNDFIAPLYEDYFALIENDIQFDNTCAYWGVLADGSEWATVTTELSLSGLALNFAAEFVTGTDTSTFVFDLGDDIDHFVGNVIAAAEGEYAISLMGLEDTSVLFELAIDGDTDPCDLSAVLTFMDEVLLTAQVVDHDFVVNIAIPYGPVTSIDYTDGATTAFNFTVAETEDAETNVIDVHYLSDNATYRTFAMNLAIPGEPVISIDYTDDATTAFNFTVAETEDAEANVIDVHYLSDNATYRTFVMDLTIEDTPIHLGVDTVITEEDGAYVETSAVSADLFEGMMGLTFTFTLSADASASLVDISALPTVNLMTMTDEQSLAFEEELQTPIFLALMSLSTVDGFVDLMNDLMGTGEAAETEDWDF